MENVPNPLWGPKNRDLYKDAARFTGVRKLIYDEATGRTRALFSNPAAGPIYYDSSFNRAPEPAEGGGISSWNAAKQGAKAAFGEAGADIKRGAPILMQKLKDFGNATANTIQGTVNHAGDYVGSKAREGRDVLTHNYMDAAQMRRDEANDVAYLHNMADVLTPGTFKDLASSAGSYMGGDKRAALHTLQGIVHNYQREMHENPAGFAMNAAAVVLPIGGPALRGMVDMDKLAAAYDALGDSRMAARARGWAKVYRERSAMPNASSMRKNMFGGRPSSPRPIGTDAKATGSPAPIGPQARPGGVLLRKENDYWVKSVNPDKHPLVRAYARQTIRSTAKALDHLGDMAAPHHINGDELWVKDVGKYPYSGYSPEFLKRYAQGSWRLRTPFNDIKPRNMGANGEIFDPALQPGGQLVPIGALGTGAWLVKSGYDAYHGK